MDYDKLIEELNNWNEYTIVELCGTGKMPCQTHCDNERCIVSRATTAIETLRTENRRLNEVICSIPTTPDSGRTIGQYDKEMSICAYLDDLEAKNKSIRADLARVTAERDAAVKKYEVEKEDFLDYALSGTQNAAPFCTNRHPDCVDKRGWCAPVKCHGFSRDKED